MSSRYIRIPTLSDRSEYCCVKRLANCAGALRLVIAESELIGALGDVDARDEQPTIGDAQVHGDFVGWVRGRKHAVSLTQLAVVQSADFCEVFLSSSQAGFQACPAELDRNTTEARPPIPPQLKLE